MRYLEVVLLLPLLLEHGQADIQRKQQRVSWILYAVNAYFFAQLATWTCFMLAYSDYGDRASFDKVYNFDPANKLLPAILLIISVMLFRCRFNSKKSQKVVASEKVIIIHVSLFLSFVVTYASKLIIFSYVQLWGETTCTKNEEQEIRDKVTAGITPPPYRKKVWQKYDKSMSFCIL